MKRTITALFFLITSFAGQGRTKGHINKATKEFDLQMRAREEHRFFGYGAPDTNSQKLICLSIFTYDVEGNPHHCPLGAFYETSDLKKGNEIWFVRSIRSFVEMKYINANGGETIFYFKRSDVIFE